MGIALAIVGGASIGLIAATLVWLLRGKDIKPVSTNTMSNVVSSPEAAPKELIAKLVRAGYLEPGLGNDAVAVAKASAWLKQDLRGGGDKGKPKAA